jgi:hypothetical protein
MLCGAFLLHCGNGAVNEMLHDGGLGDGEGSFVGDSMAQSSDTCCTPPEPPPPVVIFDGPLTPADGGSACYGPEWSISGMQSVVLHINHCSSLEAVLEYKLGMAGFVESSSSSRLVCGPGGNAIVFQPNPALGTTVRIRFPKYGGGDGAPCVGRLATLVGIRAR